MFNGIGWTEVLVVLAIVLLLFGGSKLPELARGSGRALRIFKTEVKALDGDDDDAEDNTDKPTNASATTTRRSIDQGPSATPPQPATGTAAEPDEQSVTNPPRNELS